MNKYEKRIITIFICNIIDAIATLFLNSTGIFIELNPIMRYLLHSPIAFIVFKMGIVTLVLKWLWRSIHDRKVQIIVDICWIEYLLVAIYYIIICSLYLILSPVIF